MKYPYLKVAFAVVAGFFVLLPAVLLHAWTAPPTFKSIKPWPSGTEGQGPSRALVDEWRWKWLNKWYGNSEDGVSGQQAYIWERPLAPMPLQPQLVPYMPAPVWAQGVHPSWLKPVYRTYIWLLDSWRAYAWSAWRNNANNLKRPYRGDSLTGVVA